MPELTLQQLRKQLSTLMDLCDRAAAHLETQRDLAARRGDCREVGGLQQGLLHVARLRNDLRTACHDLDALTFSTSRPSHPAAA